MKGAGGADGVGEFVVNAVALVDELGDGAECLSVRDPEILRRYVVSPPLERGCSFSAGLAHGFHHPFRNFGRARIAWITAVPSSSLTTPISNGSPVVDGR